jgi:hypothetical protein
MGLGIEPQVGGHWWHAFGTLVVAWLVIGVLLCLDLRARKSA